MTATWFQEAISTAWDWSSVAWFGPTAGWVGSTISSSWLVERVVVVAFVAVLLVVCYVRGPERRKRIILVLVFAALPAYTVCFAVWSAFGPDDPKSDGRAVMLLEQAKRDANEPAVPVPSKTETATEESGPVTTETASPTTSASGASEPPSSSTTVPAGSPVAPTPTTTVTRTKTETTTVSPPAASCASAWALTEVDGAIARVALEEVRDGDSVSAEEKLCATAAIDELDGRQFSSRLVSLVGQESEYLSDLLLGSSSSFDDVDLAYATGFLLLNALLVLLALRVFQLWRAARDPFPVTVLPIKASGSDLDKRESGLTDVLRLKLAHTGSFPAAIVGGELSAIVVEAVSVGDESSSNWLSTLMGMISRLVKLPHGYTVQATAEVQADEHTRVIAVVTNTRSGATIDVLEAEGSSPDVAVTYAAYKIYLVLTQQEEVQRRTPIWLAWTSPLALRDYHEAREKMRGGDFLNAVPLLEQAARREPANQLIQLLLGDCHLWIAQGRRDENVLRAYGPSLPDRADQSRARTERGFRRRQYLLALHAYLRAAARSRESMVAMRCVGLVLGYAEHWWQALEEARRTDHDLFDDVVRLLDLVTDPETGPPWWARSSWAVITDPMALWTDRDLYVDRAFRTDLRARQCVGNDQALDYTKRSSVVPALLAGSAREWSYAARGLRFPARVFLWSSLASRREARRLMGPVNRRRAALRKSRSAARVGIEWRLFAERVRESALAGSSNETESVAEGPSRSSARRPKPAWLLVLRTGNLGILQFWWSAVGDVAQYNIAGARALQARARRLADGKPEQVNRDVGKALDFLNRSMARPRRRMPEIELDYLLVDPDFADPDFVDSFEPPTGGSDDESGPPAVPSLELYDVAGRFAQRFDSETPQERHRRVWGEQLGVMRKGAGTMAEAWKERRRALLADDPRTPTIDKGAVYEWFRDDCRAWEALERWCDEPAVADYRRSFQSLTDRPHVPNSSPPIVYEPSKSVPDSDASVRFREMRPAVEAASRASGQRHDDIRRATSQEHNAWIVKVSEAADEAEQDWDERVQAVNAAFRTPLDAQRPLT